MFLLKQKPWGFQGAPHISVFKLSEARVPTEMRYMFEAMTIVQVHKEYSQIFA